MLSYSIAHTFLSDSKAKYVTSDPDFSLHAHVSALTWRSAHTFIHCFHSFESENGFLSYSHTYGLRTSGGGAVCVPNQDHRACLSWSIVNMTYCSGDPNLAESLDRG